MPVLTTARAKELAWPELTGSTQDALIAIYVAGAESWVASFLLSCSRRVQQVDPSLWVLPAWLLPASQPAPLPTCCRPPRRLVPRRAPPAQGARRPRPTLPPPVAPQRRSVRREQSGLLHSRAPRVSALVHPAAAHHAPRRADAAHRAGVHPREPQVRGCRGGWRGG